MESDNEVFRLLGVLSADVKHILAGLERSRQDVDELRKDVDKSTQQLGDRLTKVEKFNTRVLAYASLVVPVLIAVVQWGVPALLELL